MKKIFAGTPLTKFIAAASALTWTIAMANSAGAAQLQEARVTQVVNDVKLLLEQSAPRPAAISDLVRRGNAVRTGTQSRSELTFADLTITRLGANTIFSFKEGTREMNLIDGAILFQVPKGSGGATIRTVGVTAAITGTTGIGEFHPATTSHPQPFSKWLCLEGTFHLYLPNGQSVELGPGKMVTADGKSFSKVMTFDIAKLVSTSLFFTGFDQPLASMSLIMLESQNQLASSLLATTTNPLDPARIVNVTSQAIVAEETPSPSVSPTVTPPTPTPSKFGTPSVISSPVPYLITNGTVITTDPSITTNSVTDYGKIYRGQTDDGAFSLWAFGSTSAFDTALRIDDTFFADPSHLPIAVFKFESLSLTGDPTIDTSNGVTKLALIGVDGITSGPPGGTLTFTGLDLLVLATVNGSINLTSDVSFQDLHELVMYARGAGSDLTIDSPISNIEILGLVAEDSLHLTNPGTMSVGKLDAITGGDLMLQVGGSLLLNGRVRLDAIVLPGASVASGINLTLNVAGDYTNNSATESSRLAITNRDHIGGDANIAVGATSISTANNLDVQIANQGGGHIGGNALINIGAPNDINIVGDATFQILNSNGGHIGRDANILVTTGPGGDLTANSILALINNRNGGAIGSAANMSFNIGGALSATSDATLAISNRNDGNGGGTIDGDVNLTLNATSISAGGILLTDVSTNRGGHIMGSAHNAVGAAGLLSAGTLDFEIENAGFDSGSGFAPGGTIDADAILSVTASDISTTSDYFNEIIANDGGGHIGGNATVNVLASSMDVATNAFFSILNGQNGEGTPAGTIGGNATINVSAANISAGDALEAMIDNSNGGNIGGNALINFDVSDNLTTQGDANFQILNNDGGHIAGNGDIFVTTGGDVTANSILGLVNNRNGGAITSGANIVFDIGGTLTTQGDAVFGISTRNDGAGGGTVGSLATVDLNAASVSVGGFFQTFVATNGGGSIQGDATNSVAISGDLTAQQGILVTIEDTIFGGTGNFTGGHIGGNAIITLSGQNIITPSTNSGTPGTDSMAIEASIYPNTGGTVGGDAIVDVSASQDISAPGSVLFWVANGNYHNLGPGMIGENAEVNVSASNISTGDFFDQILNYGGASIGGHAAINLTANTLTVDGNLDSTIDNSGGTIAGDAAINMNVSDTATITNDATFQILGSDGAESAAINLNGGNYNVGGTFLSNIDGNGTITFNNASAHADVLKAGVFGTNGVLNIGGGTLSADSTLKLYAPGSNGQLNFISNVTLGGNSAKILAANSVTIFNNVVVTIGGPKPADVYTGFTGEIPNANYTGFGGNDSTTGTFAGAGANDPQPLTNAPPFGPASSAKVTTGRNTTARTKIPPPPPSTVTTGAKVTVGGNVTGRKKVDNVINVRSSDELLSVLDGAGPGPGGKITIPPSKSTNHSKNSSRVDPAGHLNAGSRVNVDRHAMDMRTASSSVMRRSPQ